MQSANDYIAITAIAISSISVIITYLGFRNSSQALKISKADFENRCKTVSLHLIKSRKIKSNNNDVFAAFNILIINNSTLPQTLISIDLSIIYKTSNNKLSEVIIYPELNIPFKFEAESIQTAPINIPSRNTLSCWCVYKIVKSIQEKEIVSYKIIAKNPENIQTYIETHLLFS